VVGAIRIQEDGLAQFGNSLISGAAEQPGDVVHIDAADLG
jgi:hypothetical protein